MFFKDTQAESDDEGENAGPAAGTDGDGPEPMEDETNDDEEVAVGGPPADAGNKPKSKGCPLMPT